MDRWETKAKSEAHLLAEKEPYMCEGYYHLFIASLH